MIKCHSLSTNKLFVECVIIWLNIIYFISNSYCHNHTCITKFFGPQFVVNCIDNNVALSRSILVLIRSNNSPSHFILAPLVSQTWCFTCNPIGIRFRTDLVKNSGLEFRDHHIQFTSSKFLIQTWRYFSAPSITPVSMRANFVIPTRGLKSAIHKTHKQPFSGYSNGAWRLSV